MKKAVFLALGLLLICVSFGNGQEKVKRSIENGVEVVLSGTKPYKLKGQPSALDLKEDFIINMESPILAEAGLTEPIIMDLDSKGNIYLLSQQSSKYFLHKFDGAGNYLTSFGRSGQGPGELQSLTFMMVNRLDEIFVVDPRISKIVIFNKEGTLKEEKKIEFRSPLIIPLFNGKYFVGFREFSPEAEYNPIRLSLCEADFTEIKELDRISSRNIARAKNIEGVSRQFFFGLNDKNLYLGNTERGYEILVYDIEGNLDKKIRKKHKGVPVSEEYKEVVKNRYKQAPDLLSKLDFPKSFPPFQYGFADDEGRLFVMTYERGVKPGEYLYDIFNPEGAFIARKGLPNWGRYGVSPSPLFAMARKGRLYCFREKESGFKEIAVYRMIWR